MARTSSKTRLVITKDTLGPGIKKFPTELNDEIGQTTDYFSPKVEGYARLNAPWTDRTGNARNGLHATAFHEGLKHGVIIAHRMPYGIWLEVRHEGRFAIIVPTVKTMGAQYMDALRGLFGRMNV